ncbi:head-tail adaptor protein [Sphingobium sp. WCS2017Hpa-17]|uniref:head-tail adaptor protein n=1 Tax=Sphingobium sp. WCS2017Hpa-17 TaxID=3073638 RepID=UPI00288C5E97|nr:head-tail adaptor protein [Sphingobium sp. WCS2017Hpa-17]
MKKGRLKWRVSIWRSATVDDGIAAVDGEPAEVGKRWAEKIDVSDGEKLRAQQMGQELSTRFAMAGDSLSRTITASDIIKCEGATYYVVGTKAVGNRRNEEVEITCSSRPDMRPS